MYRHILIATDGSDISTHAVQHGVDLARAVGAKVSFLTATEPFHVFSLEADQLEDTRPEYEKHRRERAQRILSSAGQAAKVAGISFDKIHRESDQPSEAIMEVAEANQCDLIVMGSHGRHGLSALMLGSVTMKVLAQTRRPVLVVR
jgi:nucleotide-binding universal stress UspA family protein